MHIRRARIAYRRLAQAALYDATHSRLLGTLDTAETDVRCSGAAIREYFTSFLRERSLAVQPLFCDAPGAPLAPLPPLGSSCAEALCAPPPVGAVQRLGAGVAAYSGYYCFRLLRPGEAAPVLACAKFTFVYAREPAAGALRILLHNSGLTPAGVVHHRHRDDDDDDDPDGDDAWAVDN
jgi:hypothetical protein